MVDDFKKKEKGSAYGILSNTGKTGLNWNERDSYGQSIFGNADVDQKTGSASLDLPGIHDELDTWSGQYEGQGFTSVKTGGPHFNHKRPDSTISPNTPFKMPPPV